jgi:hypothetical protein
MQMVGACGGVCVFFSMRRLLLHARAVFCARAHKFCVQRSLLIALYG